MLIVGLTGSIGMGKSTAAGHFRDHGIAVCDADAIVHALYDAEAVPAIGTAFPGAVLNGRVDRGQLSEALAANPATFRKLEAIVHPLVREKERAFLVGEAARSADIAVLEIPLLYETSADQMVDVTVVVSAPPDVQRERVLARPGMSVDKLAGIVARQMPDAEKRRRADYVVDTGGTRVETADQIAAIVEELRGTLGAAFERFWAKISGN